MPYKHAGKDKWVSPRGNTINDAQHRLWEAQGGKWPGETTSEKTMAYAKGGDIENVDYAKGGAELGRTRCFLKEQVEFRDPDEGKQGDSADADQLYAKEGEGAGDGMGPGPRPKRTGDKSLKAIKPRS